MKGVMVMEELHKTGHEEGHSHEHEHEHEHEHGGCHCCGCGHGHSHGEGDVKGTLIQLCASLALALAVGFAPLPQYARLAGFAAAYLLAGWRVLLASVRNISHGELFDENFLMSIASLGAFAIGETAEAVAVMIFYGIGEMLQDSAVAKSKRNIESLMDLRSDRANVLRGGRIVATAPEDVRVGEVIAVRPGEKIPLDGVVLSGVSFLDTRALTGESVPRRAAQNDEVLSGSVSTDGALEIRVTKPFSESTVAKILELVRGAASKKSVTEKFITKFARWYTPSVVALAVMVALLPPLAGYGSFSSWFYKALSFLIISCPCALVLSIPLSFFGGIGGAARNGILIKGSSYLEAMSKIGIVAFDKTGTLTRGIFKVAELLPAEGVAKEELLRRAAIAEARSNHPIAKSIMAAFGGEPQEKAETREIAGKGVEARTKDGVIHAGNARLMKSIGVDGLKEYAKSAVHVAFNGKYLGTLLIADELKPGIRAAMNELRAAGASRLVMLTGDNAAIAAETAAEAGIDEFRAELLPHDKMAELELLMAGEEKKAAFVGDGINDAPVLTRADIGIAMGGIGSDAAIEAADVVIMTDEIEKVAAAIRIAVKTKRIVWENIVMALGFKIAVMLLAIFADASVWLAIFADVGVALLAVANALRALKAPSARTEGEGRRSRGIEACPTA
ncbi:MAG: heavy metal translocating P-type ATPase [Synergistaceae bacterium]|nr:heavy metal translocating P-type ATPase [Synergistaceae bacterium]